MNELPVLRDERLESDDPEYLRELLQDDSLHDATLGPASESFDDWRLRTFRTASRVGYLAWQQPQDRPLLVWLAEQEHQALAESALQFYLDPGRS